MFAKLTIMLGLTGAALAGPLLTPRAAECTTITVKAGDGCFSLSQACGISGDDFTKFNPGKDLCATLVPGQKVCCTAGDLPDSTPKPNPDGSCKTYTVVAGDSCWEIGTKFGVGVTQLEAFNKENAAWKGCSNLWVGAVICVSEGTVPAAEEA